MTITELRDKRAKTWSAMEAFLDSHRNEKGVLNMEDDVMYSKMEKDLDDLTNEIKRLERKDTIEAELNKPVTNPITAKPMTSDKEDEKTGRTSNGYKKSFWNAMRNKHSNTQILNALQEGTDSEGGFLVPDCPSVAQILSSLFIGVSPIEPPRPLEKRSQWKKPTL